MSERLEATAKLYDEAARELDQAARHCEVAARHFRDGEVPRGAAHAWRHAGISWRPNRVSTNRRASTPAARCPKPDNASYNLSLGLFGRGPSTVYVDLDVDPRHVVDAVKRH